MNRRALLKSLIGGIAVAGIPVTLAASSGPINRILSECLCLEDAARSYAFVQIVRGQIRNTVERIPEDGRKWTVKWIPLPMSHEFNARGSIGRFVAKRSSRVTPERIRIDEDSLTKALMRIRV